MMKAVIAVVFLLTVVPVSILTMMWGWGLEAQNWGWVAFGYLWTLVMGAMPGMLK